MILKSLLIFFLISQLEGSENMEKDDNEMKSMTRWIGNVIGDIGSWLQQVAGQISSAVWVKEDLRFRMEYIENSLEESLKEDKGTGCEMPSIDIFAKELNKKATPYPPLKCEGQDWVRCSGSVCKINDDILTVFTLITCTYRDIIYVSDDYYYLGEPRVLRDTQEYNLVASDFVDVACTGYHLKKRTILDMFSRNPWWVGKVAGLRPVSVRRAVKDNNTAYNVLILSFDSLAKNVFIRMMPKTHNYLVGEFGATILQSHNILGEGTPAALIPLLTGSNELELPECRRGIKNSVHTDNMPFIFYKLRQHGYRTLYYEDCPDIGTFTRRFKGFLKQPTDHYLRAFLLEYQNKISRPVFTPSKYFHYYGYENSKYCIGDTPQFQILLSLTEQFLNLDGKKFAFTFIADISHDDINKVSVADIPTVKFLSHLKESGVLNNTLVIVMGDHGPAKYDTVEGKLEVRLPLAAIRLPDDLVKRRPETQKALRENSKVLTTFYDVHATILDVLNLNQYRNMYKIKGADLTRALSILEPIPRNRSCSEAGVEQHWCACQQWERVAPADPLHAGAARALLHRINDLTDFVRSECEPMMLTKIDWVVKKIPNKKVLAFKKVKDLDCYLSDYESEMAAASKKLHREVYQAKIRVSPGTGIFEGTMTYNIKDDAFTISPTEISRINTYGNEPKCISKIYPRLNPYCYCRSSVEITSDHMQTQNLINQLDSPLKISHTNKI